MPNYEVDFEYKVSEYGTIALSADNPDQADDFAREDIYETYPDATDITVVTVREVK